MLIVKVKALTDYHKLLLMLNDIMTHYTLCNGYRRKYQDQKHAKYQLILRESHKEQPYNIMLIGAQGQILGPNQIWLVYVEVCTSVSNRQCTCKFKLYYSRNKSASQALDVYKFRHNCSSVQCLCQKCCRKSVKQRKLSWCKEIPTLLCSAQSRKLQVSVQWRDVKGRT